MTLLTSIRNDLEQHIINAYNANQETVDKFLSLSKKDQKSYGKLTDTHFTSSAVAIDPSAKNILLLHILYNVSHSLLFGAGILYSEFLFL